MNKYFIGTLFGLVIGFALAALINYVRLEDAVSAVAEHISYLVLSGVAVVVALLILFVFRDAISRAIFGVATRELDSLVTEVAEAVDEVASGQHQRARSRAVEVGRSVVATVILWASRVALTRLLITLVVATAGTFGSYVLIQQNRLIERQTGVLQRQENLFKQQLGQLVNQNTLIENQLTVSMISGHLQTASRRAVYAGEVSSIVSAINTEASNWRARTEEAYEAAVGDDGELLVGLDAPEIAWDPRLTLELAERIRSLLPLLTPYVVVDFGGNTGVGFTDLQNVTLRMTSPERGDILQALISNGVNLFDIAARGTTQLEERLDFRFADMRDFEYLGGLDVSLNECVAFGEEESELSYHESWVAQLYDLTPANLTNADWSGANLSDVNIALNFTDLDLNAWSPLEIQNSNVELSEGDNIQQLPDIQLTNSSLWIIINRLGPNDLSGLRLRSPCRASLEVPTGFSSASELSQFLSGLEITARHESEPGSPSEWREYILSLMSNVSAANLDDGLLLGTIVPSVGEDWSEDFTPPGFRFD